MVFQNSELAVSVFITLKVVGMTTLILICVGIPVGYFLAVNNKIVSKIILIVCILPLVMPPTVTGFFLFKLFSKTGLLGEVLNNIFGWRITFTWIAAVIASTVISLPIMIISARQSFKNIPRELIDTTKVYSGSLSDYYLKAIFPLAKNGMLGGLVLSVTRAFGEFGATMMIAGNISGQTQTLSLHIYDSFISGNDSELMISVGILILISLGSVVITLSFLREK